MMFHLIDDNYDDDDDDLFFWASCLRFKPVIISLLLLEIQIQTNCFF